MENNLKSLLISIFALEGDKPRHIEHRSFTSVNDPELLKIREQVKSAYDGSDMRVAIYMGVARGFVKISSENEWVSVEQVQNPSEINKYGIEDDD